MNILKPINTENTLIARVNTIVAGFKKITKIGYLKLYSYEATIFFSR
jgi:hypothetical protein